MGQIKNIKLHIVTDIKCREAFSWLSVEQNKMKGLGELKEFKIIGRRVPTEKDTKPPIFRMRIFAPDVVAAKSRFWYYMKKLKKLKKSVGEIVSCEQVFEKNQTSVKNFGVWIRYNSRSGTHNMYREYRDITVTGAITQCYRDMAARHRARASSIQILKVEKIPASKCRRPHIKQMHNSKLRFPLPHRVVRSQFRSVFQAKRPHTML